MIKDLPDPIVTYVDANARLDLDGMLASFSADAVVGDEGKQLRGREALEDWIRTATIGARAILEPESWRRDVDQVVVEGPVSGDFPGSPIRFIYRFRLADGFISSLEIRDVPA